MSSQPLERTNLTEFCLGESATTRKPPDGHQEMEDYNLFMSQTQDPTPSISATLRTVSWSGGLPGVRLRSRVTDLIRIYSNSQPGLGHLSENRSVIFKSHEFFRGRLESSEVVQLDNALTYRLLKMRSAEQLLKEMGNTTMGPIAEWKWEDWASENLYGEDEEGQRRKEVFNTNLKKIKEWTLCQVPEGVKPGPPWWKPERYLAAAFSQHGKDPDAEYKIYMDRMIP